MALEGLERIDEALDCYYIAFMLELLEVNNFLRRHTNDAEAWNYRGILFDLIGDQRKALNSFNHALDIDSSCFEALSNKISILESMKDSEKKENAMMGIKIFIKQIFS